MDESNEEESNEEWFAKALGKLGAFFGLCFFAVILAVAACAVLNLMGLQSKILSDIQYWGPGIATALGSVSSVSTYYGWFRILRRRKKLNKREEAEGEAKSQLGDFIQSLPELFKSIGCLPQLATAALGASVVASTVTYTPVLEIVKPYANDLTEKVKTYLTPAPKPPPSLENSFEEPPNAEKTVTGFVNLIDITGKLYTRETQMLGRGIIGGARGTIELLQNGTVVATTQTDIEGGYAFIGVPAGEYRVRAKMDGYKQAAKSQIGYYDIQMEPEDEELYKQDPSMAGLLELVQIIKSPDKDFSKDKKSNDVAAQPAGYKSPAPAVALAIAPTLALAIDPALAPALATALGPAALPPLLFVEPVQNTPAAIAVPPPSSVVLPPRIATAIDQPNKSSAGFWNTRNAMRVAALGLSATSLGVGIYYNNQADSKNKYLKEYREAATVTGEDNYGEAYKNFHDMKNSVDNTRTVRDGLYIGAGAFGAAGVATFIF
jgi:hypothetical protein